MKISVQQVAIELLDTVKNWKLLYSRFSTGTTAIFHTLLNTSAPPAFKEKGVVCSLAINDSNSTEDPGKRLISQKMEDQVEIERQYNRCWRTTQNAYSILRNTDKDIVVIYSDLR